MVKILAFDISSSSTGYCVINNGRLIQSSIGLIQPKGNSHGQKLFNFAKEMRSIIYVHNPHKIILEDIFRGPNINTFKILAMYRGICYLVAFETLGIIPICIMPTSARKLAGVNGTKKEDAFNFILNKYKLNFNFEDDNDKSDAIILGLAGHEMDKQGLKETDLRRKKRRKRKKNK